MLKDKASINTSSHGFTIVELLVIAPIVLLTIGAFITAIVNMTGDVLASRTSNVLTYEIQDALNHIEDDVKLSSSFLGESNIDLTAPQGYGDNTTKFENADDTNGDALILNTLATTANPISTGAGLVYLDDLPNDCGNSQINQNKPMTLNIVYFVKDDTLWRRVIMPSDYTTAGCSVPWQQPSCNPGYMALNPGSSTFCKTQDIKLLDGITSNDFIVDYYNTASDTLSDSVAGDPSADLEDRNTALVSTTTVGVSINVNKTSAGRTITQSGTIRATKLDINASAIAQVIPETVPTATSGVTATFNSPGQITVNWYPNATSYTLQYDTSSSFSSPTTISDIETASKTVTGLNANPHYYFRVSSTNSAGTGAWSSTVASESTITNGLVAWWEFNGNANTSIGTGNGTVTGATLTTGQTGQANTAYLFSASCCQYILTSALPALPSTLSISAWIYPTAYPSERAALVVDSAGGSTNGYYFSISSDGSLQSYWYGTSSPGYHSSGASTIPLNQWSFGTVTWSGSQVKLYVNGVLKTTVTTTGGGATSNPIYIGAQLSSRQFAGKLDDLRVYDRVLSSDEIQSLNANGAR
jgi:hypothetical protein